MREREEQRQQEEVQDQQEEPYYGDEPAEQEQEPAEPEPAQYEEEPEQEYDEPPAEEPHYEQEEYSEQQPAAGGDYEEDVSFCVLMVMSYSYTIMQEAYNEEPETGSGRRARAIYDYQAGLLKYSLTLPLISVDATVMNL